MLKLENKKDIILELLDSGLNVAQIANNLNEYQQAVRNVIKKYRPEKSFILNQGIASTYFSKIDTHEKAYFLGFIAADGALVKSSTGNTYELTITIHSRDKYILEEFRSQLKCEHTVRDLNRDNLVRFSISNKNLTNDLINLGIVPNKSLILDSFQDKIPNEFFNSFLLGYFDGDGSIYKTNNKYYIQIRGTKNLLEDYNKFLNLDYEIKKYDSTYNLTIGSKSNIIKFISLYNKNNIFLSRKKDKFNSFLKEKCQDKTISSPLT